MRAALVFAMSLFLARINAQDSARILVPAGKSFSDVAGLGKAFRFPNFTNGHVYFRDGTQSTAKLNYNFFYKDLEYISPSGDTLALVKDQAVEIKNILIDSFTFYYYDGYLEEIAHSENGKLLKRQFYGIIKGSEKIGAYGQPSATSAIDAYTGLTYRGIRFENLVVSENMVLVLKTEYFIGDNYNTVLRANKKNLLELYPKKRAQIESYLSNNHVNFSNGADLEKLFSSF